MFFGHADVPNVNSIGRWEIGSPAIGVNVCTEFRWIKLTSFFVVQNLPTRFRVMGQNLWWFLLRQFYWRCAELRFRNGVWNGVEAAVWGLLQRSTQWITDIEEIVIGWWRNGLSIQIESEKLGKKLFISRITVNCLKWRHWAEHPLNFQRNWIECDGERSEDKRHEIVCECASGVSDWWSAPVCLSRHWSDESVVCA